MAEASKTTSLSGSLIKWQNGIGDDTKYHIAHVTSEGITLVSKMTDHAKWQEAVTKAECLPNEAATNLQQVPKAIFIPKNQLAKSTYAEKLWQLNLFDTAGKKFVVPEGKEQSQVFAAIKEYLGGEASEEEADAWSVMQSPLFVLAVLGVIGGFFIWFTTICEPNYEATGRKQGMKVLMNWIGYKIGPFWMSLAVGSLAAIVLGSMTYQLIKRPIRQVLSHSGG